VEADGVRGDLVLETGQRLVELLGLLAADRRVQRRHHTEQASLGRRLRQRDLVEHIQGAEVGRSVADLEMGADQILRFALEGDGVRHGAGPRLGNPWMTTPSGYSPARTSSNIRSSASIDAKLRRKLAWRRRLRLVLLEVVQ